MQAPQAQLAAARGRMHISCRPPAPVVCTCAPSGRRWVSPRVLPPAQSLGCPSAEARCGCLGPCSHARHACIARASWGLPRYTLSLTQHSLDVDVRACVCQRGISGFCQPARHHEEQAVALAGNARGAARMRPPEHLRPPPAPPTQGRCSRSLRLLQKRSTGRRCPW